MKSSNIASIIRDDITTVSVRFSAGGQIYVFKATKELAAQLWPGDFAIVECARGVKAVFVDEVHSESTINIEDDIEYSWLFQKVDFAPLHQQKEIDEQLTKRIEDQRKSQYRAQVIKTLGLDPETLLASIKE